MKVEQIGLRTWFLVATAGWAGALWLATGFGLGGQLSAGQAGDAAAVALPSLPPVAPERMASADSYAPIAARPLFAEDRRPRPYQLGGTEGTTTSSVRLTGVLMTGSFAMATLTTDQNRSLRLRLNGEAVDGWQLVDLQPRQATVVGPGGSQVLPLAVFDGQGGEPPTPLLGAQNGRPPPAAAAPASPPPPPAAAPVRPAQDTAPVPPPSAAAAAAAPAPASQGPSEEQMRAIRERIQARRQQLQQQQQQQSPPPGNGNGANR
ncbi:hypothetical protein [Stenotrophomonas sp. 24(2023)]|uniref:hypothetical protein n=1 Tax=Stenotrophomonas sp. 24(2023) TaxID=3068324 RepID=UPI0027DEB85A|nr:hypothetical protein [Stenotrophomonas sp. 24(2023)]WMJ67786.1 hypothetical protein Q9R17_11195 [Stenotrophomonas sp. 24(2023)]